MASSPGGQGVASVRFVRLSSPRHLHLFLSITPSVTPSTPSLLTVDCH